MVDSEPPSGGRTIAYEFMYYLDPSYIEEQLIQHGVQVDSEHEIEIVLRDLPSSDLRRRMLDAQRRYVAVDGYPTLPSPPDTPVEFLEGLERWLVGAEAQQAELDAHDHEEQERAAAEAQAFRLEMRQWIAEHGSARLKRAFRRGYKVNRLYAEERAAVEFRGFYVDTSDSAAWRERTDPSEAALELENLLQAWIEREQLKVEVRIVWLVEPPASLAARLEDDEDLWGDFEQQETIIVRPFLDRYTLVLPVDDELRNTVPASTMEHDEVDA